MGLFFVGTFAVVWGRPCPIPGVFPHAGLGRVVAAAGGIIYVGFATEPEAMLDRWKPRLRCPVDRDLAAIKEAAGPCRPNRRGRLSYRRLASSSMTTPWSTRSQIASKARVSSTWRLAHASELRARFPLDLLADRPQTVAGPGACAGRADWEGQAEEKSERGHEEQRSLLSHGPYLPVHPSRHPWLS